ncbi:MAG: oxidoreductase [Bacteroidetes bacterium]|nr:oxidoreductase [Bacteroidota bacterium]
MKRILLFVLIGFTTEVSLAQMYQWKNISVNVKSSFRALSVVDDKVAWAGGSNGFIGRTCDGGITWSFNQVASFEKLDFRSVYAFDSLRAIIANAGSPAMILQTTDGGKNWKSVYKNENKDAFIDGLDFWNEKKGMVYGDPIEGKMLLIKTVDGGNTWADLPEAQRPVLKKGEASFAASGTGIRCYGNEKVVITTGGMVSRLWTTKDGGQHWSVQDLPITQGTESTGAYSSFFWKKKGVLVGGDFKKDSQMGQHVYITSDQGKIWHVPIRPTRGLRECVEFLKDDYLIAVGPQGADLSNDGGINWIDLSDEKGFHTVRKARDGSLIVAAGNGKISVILEKK